MDHHSRTPSEEKCQLFLLITGFILLLFAFSTADAVQVLYVDQDNASDLENGLVWDTAFRTIQAAIETGKTYGEAEVWVAEGTYTNTEYAVVKLEAGVHLYGGFIGIGEGGHETTRDQRDWTTHAATIDGEGARVGVLGADAATLDGFTVTRGRGKYGGGIYNLNSSPTVAHCTFTNNTATEGGGGMHNDHSSPTVTDCVFADNSGNWGAALYNQNGAPMVSNCAFTHNTADRSGGAIYNDRSSPAVSNCTFASNNANDYGGGMSNYYSSAAVTGCNFSGNSARLGGGGMHNDGLSPNVSDCTFNGNTALNGGTSYGGGMLNHESSPMLNRCTFYNNTSDVGGGINNGVNNESSSPSLTRCAFVNNTANNTGGGMFNYRASPTVSSSTLLNNYGGYEGGGVGNTYASIVATNCVLAGNSAYVGGAIHNVTSTATLVNCVVTGNIATYNGGLLSVYGSSVTVKNCIIWGNGGEIASFGNGVRTTVTYSDVEGGYPGEGNIDQGPRFVSYLRGDYRLWGDSPCVDAGTAEGAPPTDILGLPRPQGNGVDMGAYEFPESPDSDGDQIPDDWEGTADTDNDGVPNYLDLDSDGDDLTDTDEASRGWDPYDADMDDDGITDNAELVNGLDPLNPDDAGQDPDGDGLASSDEVLTHHSNPLSSDTDGDTMTDNWEIMRLLNPLVDDTAEDADGDLFSNLAEFQINTDPQNAADPPDDVFVSNTGSNESGDGTEANPWLTIRFAMNDIARHAKDFHPVIIYLAAGLYEEPVVFIPHVTVQGADPEKPAATVIRWFGSALDNVVVRAAENTRLQDLKLTFPPVPISSVVTLVSIDNVTMEIDNVILDGGFKQNSTGVLVSGLQSSESNLHDSQIVNLTDGVWATDSALLITRNEFDQIFNDAIFVILPKDGEASATPQMGELARVETTGLNRFRYVERRCILNATGLPMAAEANDWGVYSEADISHKIYGPVDFYPYIGREMMAGTLGVNLLNRETGEQIPAAANPIVAIGSLSLLAERDGISGVFFFGPLETGTWIVNGQADGFSPSQLQATIDDGVTVVGLSLTPGFAARIGDVDSSGSVNAVDVQTVINSALGLQSQYDCDLDRNGDVNAVDVQMVINAALGLP
ncbi:MAG: hypothetical protein HY706_00420 [Candidatus Hydrogenedentes bacterium]|nr:hypothetical protein [Candidatus Hydrogenedentota bacterium]